MDVILTMENDSFCIEGTLQFILTKEVQNYSFIPLDETFPFCLKTDSEERLKYIAQLITLFVI